MAYTKIKLANLSPNNEIPAFKILMNTLSISINEAQRLIDKGRVLCDDKILSAKNEKISGLLELISYEVCPRGTKPIFENENFAIFDKDSGVLSHPNGRNCLYSLYDEIWALWGKNACITHRLDKQTSGLILVAKNQEVAKKIKKMFQEKEIYKEYLALVRGKTPLEFRVNKAINLAKNDIKTKMCIDEQGKKALTHFKQKGYYKKCDCSLLLCIPLTGRQHQIRLHLFDQGYKILGEPLYGLSRKNIENILDNKLSLSEHLKLTGAKRLLLHSYRLKFDYEGEHFDFYSNRNIQKEFFKALHLE